MHDQAPVVQWHVPFPFDVLDSAEWRNKLYDTEEFFRSRIILPINEFAGNDWKVMFVDMGLDNKRFIVDIIANMPENYERIALQICEALPDFTFSFYNRGDMWRDGLPCPYPFRTYQAV